MVLTYPINNEDYLEYVHYIFSHSLLYRHIIRVNSLIVSVFFISILMLSIPFDLFTNKIVYNIKEVSAIIFINIIIVVLAYKYILPMIFDKIVFEQLKQTYNIEPYQILHGDHTLAVLESSIIDSSNGLNRELYYHSITNIIVTKKHIYIQAGVTLAFIVPYVAFKSSEERDFLIEKLKTNITGNTNCKEIH